MTALTTNLARIAPVLRLTRVSSAFAAIANVWLVILWTRASEEELGVVRAAGRAFGPLWIDLVAGAAGARPGRAADPHAQDQEALDAACLLPSLLPAGVV